MDVTPTRSTADVTPRFSSWLILLGALVIPLVYLPTLNTRFDFIDDGNLVYPAGPMPIQERLGLVWQKIVSNYEHLGPFRPVLWAHWELAAELFQADAFRWRLARIVWSGVAAAAFLALLRELRVRPLAAMCATALAMWNPYRNEIWTSLTLSEGVAMPYALAALWCAARANRTIRSWPWDLASILGVVAALGCKNVFAALIPAQVYLRLYADGAGWREGFRRHGRRAAFLGLSLVLPIGHYIYYRLNWHPGQYPPASPTLAQLGRILKSLAGAESLDFMALGFAATLIGLYLAVRAGARLSTETKTVVLTGGLLLAAGIAVYLPIPAISGRYTIPAVWGLDLIVAAALSSLTFAPAPVVRRVAWGCTIGGLVVVAVANVGRQEKFAARADLLWQTLEYVERSADGKKTVSWYESAALNGEEGIHFHWHLLARGHDIPVQLFDHAGVPQQRCEIQMKPSESTLAVTGTDQSPPGNWELQRIIQRPYWQGRRNYESYVWAAR